MAALKAAEAKADAVIRLFAKKKADARAGAAAIAQRQGAVKDHLDKSFDAVARSFFPGKADELAQMDLKAGDHFKAFLAAHRSVEQNPDDPAALTTLEGAANSYLAHHDRDLSDKEKAKPETRQKRAQCLAVRENVALMRLRLEHQALSQKPQPWDLDTEGKADALHAKLLFEGGGRFSADGKSGAKPLGDGDSKGVSGAWFVEAKMGEGKKADKLFIFKPGDAEPEFGNGWEPNSGAVREVMAKVIDDQVLKMTGLDLGVCPTNLVTIANANLPQADGKPDPNLPAQRSGAMQQLAPNQGSFSQKLKDPGFASRVPLEDVQNIAVLDFLTLNFDRHGGNILVDDPGGGADPKLIPIDHGKSMPNRIAYGGGGREIKTQNTLMRHMPDQVDRKFSDEMVASLDQLDPDAMAVGLTKARGDLAKSHPADAAKFGDDTIGMIAGSAAFLKKAARELTVAQMYEAYATDMLPVFDAPDEATRNRAIDAVIAAAKARTAAAKEIKDTFPDPDRALNQLIDLGWGHKLGMVTQLGQTVADPSKEVSRAKFLIEDDPARMAKILKGRIENPMIRKDIADLLKTLGGEGALPFKLAGLSLPEQFAKLDLHRLTLASQQTDAQRQQEIDALGGDDVAKGYFLKYKLGNYDQFNARERLDLFRSCVEYEKLGGDAELVRRRAPVTGAIRFRLEQLKGGEPRAVAAQVDAIDADAMAAGALNQASKAVIEGLKALASPSAAGPLKKKAGDTLAMAKAKDPRALDAFYALEQDLKAVLKKEGEKLAALPGRLKAAAGAVVALGNPPGLAKLLGDANAAVPRAGTNLDQALAAVRDLEVAVDNAQKGDQSEQARLVADLEAARKAVDTLPPLQKTEWGTAKYRAALAMSDALDFAGARRRH